MMSLDHIFPPTLMYKATLLRNVMRTKSPRCLVIHMGSYHIDSPFGLCRSGVDKVSRTSMPRSWYILAWELRMFFIFFLQIYVFRCMTIYGYNPSHIDVFKSLELIRLNCIRLYMKHMACLFHMYVHRWAGYSDGDVEMDLVRSYALRIFPSW